jgi:exodeoxyribonuclease VII large subunit
MSFHTDLFPKTTKVLTVGQLTRAIRGTLETKFGAVWVEGEVSNYKLHPSGHQYFTLKDQRAQISCVIFRSTNIALPRQPLADGAQVQVYASISVFEARGQYQLNVQILQPRGLGLLQAKFDALKRKLEAEGLFAAERKRQLPRFPRRIGIVTSSSGAALRDILNVLQRRAPWLELLINPVRVQGSGAAAEISVAIRELAAPNERWQPVDLIVVTRGGGSMEDLWEFNEEIVARTIASVNVPVVSAVGHEIDFTICDFVADLRAPTPSAAAELIVPDMIDLRRRIQELGGNLQKCLLGFLEHQRTRLRFLSQKTLRRELANRIREAQQQLDLAKDSFGKLIAQRVEHSRRTLVHAARALKDRAPAREILLRRQRFNTLEKRLFQLPPHMLDSARQRFARVNGLLRVLGPDATLRRGYSITTTADGRLVRTVKSVRPKMKIRTRLADGEFESTT